LDFVGNVRLDQKIDNDKVAAVIQSEVENEAAGEAAT
jgi:hypothetical protein